MEERELLRKYADEADDRAFADLVRRHGPWLFSAARRQLGDEHLAEDVTQAVFLLLARRAKRLAGYSYLSGWLFGTLGFCVKHAKRQRARREKREQEAASMRPEAVQEANWDDIAPLLETVVGRLGKADRDAVLLRFYEQKPLAEVGRLMGVTEEAARKRVERAVEKLRGMLQRQGVTGTSAGLSAALVGNVVQEVPARVIDGVMKAIGGSGGSAVAAGIAGGAVKMMVAVKVKVVVLLAGVAIAAGAVSVSVSLAGGPSTQAGAAKPASVPVAATRPIVTADQAVQDLIPLIEAGERKLLGDLEITYTDQRRNAGKPKDPRTIESMELKVTLIIQGGRSFYEDDVVTIAAGQQTETVEQRTWDGQFHRLLILNPTNGSTPDWAISTRLFDPNARALPEPLLSFTLNEALMSQVIRNGIRSLPGRRQHFQRLPDEDYLGQRCVRIQAVMEEIPVAAIIGPATWTWWLAPASGYLPVRMVNVIPMRNGFQGGLTIESNRMKEVSPGLFLPAEVTVTLADPEGGYQRQFSVETLSLAPSYPNEKFAVPAPPGAKLSVFCNRRKLTQAAMDAKWTPAAAEALLREAIAKDAVTTRPSAQ